MEVMTGKENHGHDLLSMAVVKTLMKHLISIRLDRRWANHYHVQLCQSGYGCCMDNGLMTPVFTMPKNESV